MAFFRLGVAMGHFVKDVVPNLDLVQLACQRNFAPVVRDINRHILVVRVK